MMAAVNSTEESLVSRAPCRIDVTGFDAGQTLAKEHRRQAEAALAVELDPVDALLLPLAMAVARLTARQKYGAAS